MIHVLLVMTVSRRLTHKLTASKAWSLLCGEVSACRRRRNGVGGVVTTPAYAGRRTARQDDEGGGRWTLQGWNVSASGLAQRRLPRPADRPHHRISDLPRLCRVILCAARRSHRLLPLSGDHHQRRRAKDRRAVLL